MSLDLRKKVAVVGVGCTQFGELYERSPEDLLCDAVDEALGDAGCDRERIEAAWVGTVMSPFGGDGLADALKLFGRPMTRVQNYCASGMDAFRNACLAVAAGMHDPWTRTWVARALDYSELSNDLGREGIARDVRQVLGKPGQGPPEEERRRALPARPAPSSRRNPRTKVLGKIDKGVFFPGDARAEMPDLGRGKAEVGPDDVVDLPTPAPGAMFTPGRVLAKRASISAVLKNPAPPTPNPRLPPESTLTNPVTGRAAVFAKTSRPSLTWVPAL